MFCSYGKFIFNLFLDNVVLLESIAKLYLDLLIIWLVIFEELLQFVHIYYKFILIAI